MSSSIPYPKEMPMIPSPKYFEIIKSLFEENSSTAVPISHIDYLNGIATSEKRKSDKYAMRANGDLSVIPPSIVGICGSTQLPSLVAENFPKFNDLPEGSDFIVLTHSPCVDGELAGEILVHAIGKEFGEKVDVYPVNQGLMEFDICGEIKPSTIVIIADCVPMNGFGPTALDKLCEICRLSKMVIIIDHHENNKNVLDRMTEKPDNLHIHFDLNASASILIYQWTNGILGSSAEVPPILQLVAGHDLCRWYAFGGNQAYGLPMWAPEFSTWCSDLYNAILSRFTNLHELMDMTMNDIARTINIVRVLDFKEKRDFAELSVHNACFENSLPVLMRVLVNGNLQILRALVLPAHHTQWTKLAEIILNEDDGPDVVLFPSYNPRMPNIPSTSWRTRPIHHKKYDFLFDNRTVVVLKHDGTHADFGGHPNAGSIGALVTEIASIDPWEHK